MLLLITIAVVKQSLQLHDKSDEVNKIVHCNSNRSELCVSSTQVRWKFAGTNIYWLGRDENAPDSATKPYPSKFRVSDAISTAVKIMGANTIRSHTLGVATAKDMKGLMIRKNQWNERYFEMIDYSINYASSLGVKLIVPLTDNWLYVAGGKHDFVRMAGVNDDSCNFPDWTSVNHDNLPCQIKHKTNCLCACTASDHKIGSYCPFYFNEDVKALFKSYIKKLLTHMIQDSTIGTTTIGNSPTILAFETGNELVGENAEWTTEICLYIKSIAPNALVIDGRDEVREGIDNDAISIDCVDIVTAHSYGWLSATDLWIKPYSSIAKSHGKAYFVGEFGWTKNCGGNDLLQDFYLKFFKGNEYDELCDGVLYWSLFGHLDSSGFEQHKDGWTLHFPGDSEDMNERVSTIRTGTIAIVNNQGSSHWPTSSYPYPVTIPAADFLKIEKFIFYWRGAYGAIAYDLEICVKRNLRGGVEVWESLCKECLWDLYAPQTLPPDVLNKIAIGDSLRMVSINGDRIRSGVSNVLVIY